MRAKLCIARTLKQRYSDWRVCTQRPTRWMMLSCLYPSFPVTSSFLEAAGSRFQIGRQFRRNKKCVQVSSVVMTHAYTGWAKKVRPQTHGQNSVKSWPIFNFFFTRRFLGKFVVKRFIKNPTMQSLHFAGVAITLLKKRRKRARQPRSCL